MRTQIKTTVSGSAQLTRKLDETTSTAKQATCSYTVPFYAQQNDKFFISTNPLLYIVHVSNVFIVAYTNFM
jgi:hypothetical protein